MRVDFVGGFPNGSGPNVQGLDLLGNARRKSIGAPMQLGVILSSQSASLADKLRKSSVSYRHLSPRQRSLIGPKVKANKAVDQICPHKA